MYLQGLNKGDGGLHHRILQNGGCGIKLELLSSINFEQKIYTAMLRAQIFQTGWEY